MKSREDWLCEQLDNDNLSATLRAKYEQELDDFASRHTNVQAKIKKAQEQEAQRRAYIKAQLLAGNLDAVDTFGMEEFGPDYEIVLEAGDHVIYSKVARDDQNDRHRFTSKVDADAKLRKLVWDRMYHKYVRSGELESVWEVT